VVVQLLRRRSEIQHSYHSSWCEEETALLTIDIHMGLTWTDSCCQQASP
jgi:hypothetical protein